MSNREEFIFNTSKESILYRKFLQKWNEWFPKIEEEMFPDEEKFESEEKNSEDKIYDDKVKVEETRRVQKVFDVKSKKYLIVEL